MKFEEAPIAGAWIIEQERVGDERGWFARIYDEVEFGKRAIAPVGIQCNASFNAKRDTVRGLHFQREPDAEAKLVRCVAGAIWDVAVDLRPASPTYLRWHAVKLSAADGRAYFIPAGCAHGFQTLSADAEVHYMMGHPYAPDSAAGVRWNDPAFGITWPEPREERTISNRDQSYPDFLR